MDGVPHRPKCRSSRGELRLPLVRPMPARFGITAFLVVRAMARGLYGALLSRSVSRGEVDRDLVLVVTGDDKRWRHPPSFGTSDAAGGTAHNTSPSHQDRDLPVKTNERVRCVVNAANARIFQFCIARHRAGDGRRQPRPPYLARRTVGWRREIVSICS